MRYVQFMQMRASYSKRNVFIQDKHFSTQFFMILYSKSYQILHFNVIILFSSKQMLMVIIFKLYYRSQTEIREIMNSKQQQSLPQLIKQTQGSISPNSSNLFNSFFQINCFFQQKNKLTTLIILSFKYLLPSILLLKDLPVSQQTSIVPQMKKLLNEYSIAFHTLITFNKFLIIGNIITLYHETFHSNLITKEINRIFKTKLRGLIEIDFHISMFFISFDMLARLPSFLFSICIYIFASVFLENYINKQDMFYCASSRVNIIYRFLLMLGYFIAAFLFADISNSGGLKVAISLYVIVVIIWFYLYGCIMYPNELMSKGMIGFISLIISAYILIIQKHFLGGSQCYFYYLIKINFTFIVSLLASYLIIQKRKERKFYKQNYHIFQIKNVLNDLFINQTSTEKIAFIYARIQLHQQSCRKINCEIHSLNLYSQRIHGDNWSICMILKSYFRCLYEEHLNRQSSDSWLLQYLEYLYSEKNPNQYKISMILAKIDTDLLDIFDRPSLWGIRRNIEKIFKNNMDQLYNGKLNFEQTLAFDESYKKIQKQINYLIKSNIKIYRHLEKTQIDLNVVFDTIWDNLNIQKSLSNQWLAVSNSLKNKKDLTIAYYYYKQLIKNQRLSRQDLQLMNIQQLNNSNEQSIFLTQGNCFNPDIILHKETMVFTCTLLNYSLLFKDINHNFQYYMGYNREELLMSSIDHILNDDLRQIHQQGFKSWMEGTLKSSFQKADFQLKKTQCLTKDKVVLPVLKYFKSYLNSNSQLQFVCMLKVNKKVNTQINDKIQSILKNSQEIELQQNKLLINFNQDKKITQFTNDYAIFIKDKQFQPSSKSGDISSIKKIIFIFFILICVSLMAFHLVTIIYAAKLQSYTQQYITFMQCYRFPMILGNSYLQSILSIGNQARIASQIDSWSKSFTALASNPIILQTLYDLSINLPRYYYPYRSGKQIFNQSEKLDQLQIFYMISSSISSLRAPINPQQQNFIIFDQLITPSYDNMLNSTKQRFHQSFIDYTNQIINNQIIIGITQISIEVLFLLMMINRIRVFVRKMKFISDTIVNYKKEDLYKILHYWIDVNNKFRHIFGSYTRREVIKSKKNICSQIKNKKKPMDQQFTNRINKTIIQSRHYKNFNKISIISIFVAIIIVAVSFSATEINRISELNYLIYFENEGYLFLRYFPTATIVGYGCNSRYRSQKNPQIVFNSSRFDTSISAMKLVGDFTYIADVKQEQSAYFSKQRNYFFGNPCRYNPNVINNIGVSIASCQSVINGSFSRGLTSYMREGSIRAEKYIQGITNMTTAQLSQFSLSVSILSGYILDAIHTWGTEFNENLVQFVAEQAIFTSINFSVLIVVFAVIYWFFIRYLEKEYYFYRYMFMKMIPEYILRTDKVARQTFINFNILE